MSDQIKILFLFLPSPPPPHAVSDDDDLVSYDRGCGNSEEDFNGETDKCEHYVRFGEENHHCVCQGHLCNGAEASYSSSVVVASVLAALWTLRGSA